MEKTNYAAKVPFTVQLRKGKKYSCLANCYIPSLNSSIPSKYLSIAVTTLAQNKKKFNLKPYTSGSILPSPRFARGVREMLNFRFHRCISKINCRLTLRTSWQIFHSKTKLYSRFIPNGFSAQNWARQASKRNPKYLRCLKQTFCNFSS